MSTPTARLATATKYPKRLDDLRRLLEAVGWEELRAEFDDTSRPRLAIVGPVNAGKSTLFNAIAGAERSEVSPVPGTTTTAVEELVGPLQLVDTPGAGEPGDDERWGAAWQQVVAASGVVLVLDAAAGLRQADVALWQAIAALGSPALVTLNKIDLLRADDLIAAIAYVEQQLATKIIPISAERGTNVAELLMPALLDLEPTVTVALGRALPGFRRTAAERIVREAAGLAAAAGARAGPLRGHSPWCWRRRYGWCSVSPRSMARRSTRSGRRRSSGRSWAGCWYARRPDRSPAPGAGRGLGCGRRRRRYRYLCPGPRHD